MHQISPHAMTNIQCSKAVFFYELEGSSKKEEQSLIWNLNKTACAPSMGVHRSREVLEIEGDESSLESQGSMEDLLDKLGTLRNGVSFELWIKSEDFNESALAAKTDTRIRPILTIGQRRRKPSSALTEQRLKENLGLNPCSANLFDFQLIQHGNTLELYYRTSDAFFEPCQRLVFGNTTLESNKLAHVVVSLGDGSQQVFVNGQASVELSQNFPNDLSHWNRNYSVQLLDYKSSDSVVDSWSGTLYQLTVYPSTLSPSDVIARMKAGLPASPPYALSYTTTIHEDAERIAGSHSTEWYKEQAPTTEAARIILRVGSMERDVRDLFDRVNLDVPWSPPTPVHIYLTSLPSKGVLYTKDGVVLGASQVLPDGDAASSSLLIKVDSELEQVNYLPPLHAHSSTADGVTSVFTTFRYCVTSIPIFDSMQCQSAVVSLRVLPVNDPPVADNVGSIRVTEDAEIANAPKIRLSGTDVDIGDSVQFVQITQPPTHGQLILSVSSFRKDGLVHGTLLSDADFFIRADDPVYVKYIWSPGYSSSVIVQGADVTDSFSFRVADRSGLWSEEKMVQIEVLSAVRAFADSNATTLPKDSRLQRKLNLRGIDQSGHQRGIGYFVETIPSPEEGLLLDPVNGQPIKAGAMLTTLVDFPYNNAAELTFIPSPGFCSNLSLSPGQTTTDLKFRFRATAMAKDDSSRVVSVSDSVTQSIRVACAIDALSLKGPSELFSLKKLGLHQSGSDPCRGPIFDHVLTDRSFCNFAAIIDGIEITNHEQYAEQVHVTISVGAGYLTFNEIFWNRTEPIYGRRASAAQKVEFLAYPDDLNNIFSGLHFQSNQLGEDAIEILLQYGDCSHTNQPPPPFSTPTCQRLQHRIPIMVLDGENIRVQSSHLISGFPWQILFCLLGYPLLYYLFVQLRRSFWSGTGEDDTKTKIENPPPLG